jgi:hypothetical protein
MVLAFPDIEGIEAFHRHASIEHKTPPRFLMLVRSFFTEGEKDSKRFLRDLPKCWYRGRSEAEIGVGTKTDARIYFPDCGWLPEVQRAIA